jgi:hypothetical protein
VKIDYVDEVFTFVPVAAPSGGDGATGKGSRRKGSGGKKAGGTEVETVDVR